MVRYTFAKLGFHQMPSQEGRIGRLIKLVFDIAQQIVRTFLSEDIPALSSLSQTSVKDLLPVQRDFLCSREAFSSGTFLKSASALEISGMLVSSKEITKPNNFSARDAGADHSLAK